LHCSRCGTRQIESEVEGRLRPVCPVCGYVAYRQLKVGAAVLVEREEALLLVCRGPVNEAFPGTWNLPSGYCEADEAPPLTAARETAEEVGLQVQVGRLMDAYPFDDDPRGSGLLLVYEAQIVGGELASDGREAVDARFFPPDGLPGALCGGGHDRAIQAWRERALDRWQPGEPMRYCPHCAHPLEERLAFDRIRPACPACGFIHFRELKVGVSVLVEQAGRLLLVQRAVEPGLGQWCLPSGFVEWDETPEVAAARECAEETGLAVGDLELLGVSHYTDDYRGPGINLTYRAWVTGGRLRAGDDAGAVRFFGPGELPVAEAIAFQGHRLMVDGWRRTGRPPAG
jgi:ADP-ribose pyrophosphatase YjhB (NUDIX family)